MNWDHLKVFLQVARTGTASAAAQHLEINHTTVIRRIDQLEKDLGIRLFHRLQQGYRLTDEGHEVLTAAEAIEADTLALERLIKGQTQAPSGRLCISHPGHSLLDLSAALARFSQQHPAIQLLVQSTEDATNLNRLEADVAIRLTDTPPDTLIGRCLGRVEFGIYADRQYLATKVSPPSPRDVDWVLWMGSTASDVPEVRRPDHILMNAIGSARVALRTNSIETLVAAIVSGMGAGPMNRAIAQKHPNLVELPFSHLLVQAGQKSVGIWLLNHEDLRQNAVVRSFNSFMVEDFNASSEI